jgi:hypothetical protein
MYDHDHEHHDYVSVCATGSIRADFCGPEEAVVITITDLRAATPMGAGIEVIKGRKRYASYHEAEQAACVIAAKMTGLTVAQLNSGAFYNTNR